MPGLSRALIVGTSPMDRLNLARYLRQEGVADVMAVADGIEAICLLSSELVDAVFATWAAGQGDGARVLRYLQRRHGRRRVPVVLLDDGLARETIVAAVKAGVAGVLPLPPARSDVGALLTRLRDEAAGEGPA